MNDFLLFNPIGKEFQEDLLNYYQENGLELPDHPVIQQFFAAPTDQISTKTSNPTPKKSIFQKKSSEPINMPKFSVEATIDHSKNPENNWPNKDNTIKDILDKSTANPNKLMFLNQLDNLKVDNDDKEYLAKLAGLESSYRPDVTNKYGYTGYYQLGKDALSWTGFTKNSLKDPENQHLAALKLANLNIIPFKKYIGQVVNGITLTKNSLRAAAHLAGASGLKDWLEGTKKTAFAKRGFVDANGTPIEKYLQEFSQ